MLTRADIWFDLPPGLIAQHPLPSRADSRLMLVERSTGGIRHCTFRELPSLLLTGDLLVFNDTKVIRARLRGSRAGTGGAVELLLVERQGPGRWKVLAKPGRRARAGLRFEFGSGLAGEVLEVPSPGRAVVAFSSPGRDPEEALAAAGEVPLPPYIRRDPVPGDDERYQTIYARSPGAVAAPTAGLHFDRETLSSLEARGVSTASLTLHVGPGTFQPLRHDDIDMNELEAERFEFPAQCAEAVASARRAGGRIVAVGTTSARVLETVGPGAAESAGLTSLFIRPPYRFGAVDALLTNFHLPGSSLMCLVAAFAGLDLTMRAYECAITERYRFYSFGDAMLIL